MVTGGVLGDVYAFGAEEAQETFTEDIDEYWIEKGFDGVDGGGDEVAAPCTASRGWTLKEIVVGFVR